jgi:hypothetical protein
MRRRLERPKNSEALGQVLAALRVYGGQREPKNRTERSINDALKAQRISTAVVKRMLRTLDSMPKRARNTLLGNIADPKFVRPHDPKCRPHSR